MDKQRIIGDKERAKMLAEAAVDSLNSDKAENIEVIDLEGKTDFAHFMVVASGRSSRHVSALADKVTDKFKVAGVTAMNVEGLEKSDWVLVDAFDVVVHIFRPEIRENYDLEKIWSFSIKE